MIDRPDEVLEVATLERLNRIGGQEFLVEMIDLFLLHAPQRLRTAREALASGDLHQLYRAAHSLKSTAGNLGARGLEDVARRLEERASGGDAEAAGPLLEAVELAYDHVRARLEAERRRRSGGTEADERKGRP